MLLFTVYHKFTTEAGEEILIPASRTPLASAEKQAKAKDPSAKFVGIEIKY